MCVCVCVCVCVLVPGAGAGVGVERCMLLYSLHIVFLLDVSDFIVELVHNAVPATARAHRG